MPLWRSSSGEQQLGTSFAYRSSDYSSVGRFDSWKVGLDFQIIRDLRLRATQSRDVREATFSERFDNSPTGGTVLDPASNQASSTITVTSAGNPDLTPEVGDTTVVGLVYQPRWAENLRMSIDHYEIDVADWIATLGAQRVVDECYTSNVLCEYVFRDDPGVLSRVLSPYLNLDSGRAEGTDFEVVYARDVNLFDSRDESLSIRLLGGKLDERSSTVVGGVPAEFAGTRGLPRRHGERDAVVPHRRVVGAGPGALYRRGHLEPTLGRGHRRRQEHDLVARLDEPRAGLSGAIWATAAIGASR